MWLKLSDKLSKILAIKPSIVTIDYLGLGGFHDYSTIWANSAKEEFKSYGWEIKSMINILGLSTIQKFGQAYDYDQHKLGNYYQVEIALLVF